MEHPLIDLISQVFLPEVTSTPTIEIPSGNGTNVTLNLSLPSNVAVHGSLTGVSVIPMSFTWRQPMAIKGHKNARERR